MPVPGSRGPIARRPRTALAVLAGKATGAVSRLLGWGGGTALPGLIAERIDPGVVARLAGQIGASRILVTGTNGKTTTARLLGAILQANGQDPIRNSAGSNLMRGLAATLVGEAGPLGGVSSCRPGIFEVDEATLLEAAATVRPDLIVFTNLFRDQLDRYGEIDAIADVWRKTLAALPEAATVVLNANDPLVAGLRSAGRARVVTYGIADPSVGMGAADHASDSRWCPTCERDYVYDALFFGHVGWWRCPGCGDHSPEPDVSVNEIELCGDDSARFRVTGPGGEAGVELGLAGLYNVENALAAAAAAFALAVPIGAVESGLTSATAAFGRQERLTVRGRDVRVLLGKNPAGLNQTLRTIALHAGPKDVLFALNDDIADGTDVSWIWDVDYEMLAGQVRRIGATGRRAEDMALRLKYAGFTDVAVESDIGAALRNALTPDERPLYIIPTYTAMLEAREMLGRWSETGHYWERAS